MSIMETMEPKQPRARRSFTAEFKAEIVELCRRGDRSIGQVARDFDLTETAVREWVRQAERDAGTRSDGGLTSAERQELSALRRENQRLRQDVEILKRATAFFVTETRRTSSRFIEAEKAQQRNIKRTCQLLKVSRAATTPTAPPSHRPAGSPTTSSPSTSAKPTRRPRAATAHRASTPTCVAAAIGTGESGWPG
jgi:transposase